MDGEVAKGREREVQRLRVVRRVRQVQKGRGKGKQQVPTMNMKWTLRLKRRRMQNV